MKTFNENGKYNFPLIKENSNYFHYDVGKKLNVISKKIENKINEKFEKDLKNETGENTLKGKEMKPPENENWGDFNSFDNISDIEKDN